MIGAGYKAFVVHGYGQRELTFCDTRHLENPFSRKKTEEIVKSTTPKKCSTRTEKDFFSKYDLYMKERESNRIELKNQQIEAERQKIIAVSFHFVRERNFRSSTPNELKYREDFFA